MKIRKIMGMTLLCAAAMSLSAFAAAEENSEKTEAAAAEQRSYEVLRFSLPEDAIRLVVVEADGLTANVSMYAKTETEISKKLGPGESLTEKDESWQLIVSTDEGLIGRKGMGKTVEGDEKTPAGLYKMNTPFGTAEAQEGFPENYLQVDARYYWNGDSDSPRYNKLVDVNEYSSFNKSKSEHLSTYGGISYRYCIDTGYNIEGTPHKGSALFLHCSAGANTAGCIAIPEAAMTEIMKQYREGSTYIILDSRGCFEKYYGAEIPEA